MAQQNPTKKKMEEKKAVSNNKDNKTKLKSCQLLVVSTRSSTCTICGKILCDKFSLKKHVDTVHLTIRPFECFFCQKRFIIKSDLEAHVTNIHEKKKVIQEGQLRIYCMRLVFRPP